MSNQRARLVYVVSHHTQSDIVPYLSLLIQHVETLPFHVTIVDIATQPKPWLVALQQQYPALDIIMVEAVPTVAWGIRTRMLVRVLQQLRPHVVHILADTPDVDLDIITASWLAQVPWRVASFANVFARATTDSARPVVDWMRAKILKSLHEIIVYTTAAKTVIVDEYHVIHNTVRVIPIGIDSQTYALHAIPKRQRDAYHLDTTTPLIAAIGPFIHAKGHAVLIHAMERIWEQIPHAQLLLVGDGPERAELLTMAQHTSQPSQIHFMGTLQQPQLLLPLIDIVVQPSFAEAMSYQLLMAMALERPIVATAIPNISTIIESNASGLLVRPGDSESLASAITRLWHDDSLRITVSLNARTRVSQRFLLSRWQHDTVACYRARA